MTSSSLPLSGIKVLDLSRVLAGPWATMSLADLGAEVWKIENVNGGDDTRAWSLPSYKGVSTYYLSANRGKHSLAVDLKSPEGRQMIKELAAQADVVVENFRAGTVDRLGIGYEDLRKINDRLIYCSISGYGQNGPEAERPGYDFVMQAESGLMAITGEVDGAPHRLGVAFTDVTAGMVATQSILAALYQRHATGVGQYIDVALLETTLNLLINVGSAYLNTGIEPQRFGNAHPTVVPYQTFNTADQPFALAIGNTRQFVDFCEKVLNRTDLATDPRFQTGHGRAFHRDALIPAMQEVLLTQTSDHWLEACRSAELPAGKVKTVAEALSSPTVEENGVIQVLSHPELGEVRLIRPAQGLAAQRGMTAKAPPLLGEDSAELLRDKLGYSDEQIRALHARGVILCRSYQTENAENDA